LANTEAGSSGKKVAERVGAITQKKPLQDWITGSI
jgi:hypothetical protein